MVALKIPYHELSPEALHGVVEEFVTRDGTDYGEIEVWSTTIKIPAGNFNCRWEKNNCRWSEVPLETKIAQVLTQLREGKAVIVFDPGTETTTILSSNDPVLKGMDWKKNLVWKRAGG